LQVGKVLFAGRHPALVDLAAETVGGLAGAALWAHLADRRPVDPARRPGRPAASDRRTVVR
ncbi:MAG TPA: hypothetical protein VF743_10175, partial [Acidimicrobiales bacterium]